MMDLIIRGLFLIVPIIMVISPIIMLISTILYVSQWKKLTPLFKAYVILECLYVGWCFYMSFPFFPSLLYWFERIHNIGDLFEVIYVIWYWYLLNILFIDWAIKTIKEKIKENDYKREQFLENEHLHLRKQSVYFKTLRESQEIFDSIIKEVSSIPNKYIYKREVSDSIAKEISNLTNRYIYKRYENITKEYSFDNIVENYDDDERKISLLFKVEYDGYGCDDKYRILSKFSIHYKSANTSITVTIWAKQIITIDFNYDTIINDMRNDIRKAILKDLEFAVCKAKYNCIFYILNTQTIENRMFNDIMFNDSNISDYHENYRSIKQEIENYYRANNKF